MKKIVTILILLFTICKSFAQTYPLPYGNLGNVNVATRDSGGLFVRQTFVPPILPDTNTFPLGTYPKNYNFSIVGVNSDTSIKFRFAGKWYSLLSTNSNIGGNSWNLTGNAGTNPSINFLGTTDNQDLVIKRNNVKSGLINFSNLNTSWGVNTMPVNTAANNTAIGAYSLASNIGGGTNTAIGAQALTSNTTGGQNVAVGGSAFGNNMDGSYNTGIGNGTGGFSSHGKGNTYLGYGTGAPINFNDTFNIGFGFNATPTLTKQLFVSDSTIHLRFKNLDSASGTAPSIIGKDGNGDWHVYANSGGGTNYWTLDGSNDITANNSGNVIVPNELHAFNVYSGNNSTAMLEDGTIRASNYLFNFNGDLSTFPIALSLGDTTYSGDRIPLYLPSIDTVRTIAVSVNGVLANKAGNIILPVGSSQGLQDVINHNDTLFNESDIQLAGNNLNILNGTLNIGNAGNSTELNLDPQGTGNFEQFSNVNNTTFRTMTFPNVDFTGIATVAGHTPNVSGDLLISPHIAGFGLMGINFTGAASQTWNVDTSVNKIASSFALFDTALILRGLISGKQNTLTLTTTGTSGAATLVGSTLNIPQYTAGTGTVTSVATGYGILGGTITTTGTLTADTASGIGLVSKQRLANSNYFVRSGDSTSYTWYPNQSTYTTAPASGIKEFDSSGRMYVRTSLNKTYSISTSNISANGTVTDSLPNYSMTIVGKFNSDSIFNKTILNTNYYVTPDYYLYTGQASTDSVAVQLAANSGKPVMLIRMYTANNISVPAGASIYGLNDSLTGIYNNGRNNPTLLMNGSDIRLDGFYIKADSVGGATSLQTGITIDGTNYQKRDIMMTRLRLKGLNLGLRVIRNGNSKVDNTDARGIIWSSNFIDTCSIGIKCDTLAEYFNIWGYEAQGCGIAYWNKGGNNSIDGGLITGGHIGILIDSGSNDSHSHIVGVTINATDQSVMVFNTIQQDYTVSSCISYGTPASGIIIKNSKGVKISGCTFNNLTSFSISITGSTNTEMVNNTWDIKPTLTQTNSLVRWVGNNWKAGLPTGLPANDIGTSGFLSISNENLANVGTTFNTYNLANSTTSNRYTENHYNYNGTTLATKTATVNGQLLYSKFPVGYDGTNDLFKADFTYIVNGTVTTNQMPIDAVWSSSATTAARTERMRLAANGNFNVGGNTAPTSTFSVGSTSQAQIRSNGNASYPNYWTTSSTPSIAAGTGAGTTPTVSVTGTNQGGVVNVTTGTLPTLSGTVATITFSSSFAFPTGCSVILYPANSNTAILSGASMVFTNGTTTTFVITAGTTALTGSTAYSWNYKIEGY